MYGARTNERNHAVMTRNDNTKFTPEAPATRAMFLPGPGVSASCVSADALVVLSLR
jgi:hypothetical protein